MRRIRTSGYGAADREWTVRELKEACDQDETNGVSQVDSHVWLVAVVSIRATLKNSTLGAVSVCRGSAYRGGDDDAVAQLRGSDTLKE